ncbi:MAG: hypothetical protein ACODAG_11795 [Myxococcota bacterium]
MMPAELTIRLRRRASRWGASLEVDGVEIATGGHATAQEAAVAALKRFGEWRGVPAVVRERDGGNDAA